MYIYKVFKQIDDYSFIEVAQTTYLEAAEAVYSLLYSGMITENGVIIQTKNLTEPLEVLF